MPREEIAEVLTGKGYTLLESIEGAFTGPNYTIPMDRWSKGDLVPEGERGTGSPRDEISVVFSSTKSWMEQDYRAITIRRGLIPAPTDGLTISAFQRSVQKKYGANIGNYGGTIHYSREGSPVSRTDECQKGSLQSFRPAMASLSTRHLSADQLTLHPYCLGQVHVSFQSDRSTGLLTAGIVTVASSDDAWQEFWENWSKQEYDAINTTLNALRGAGEGPDL